MQLPAEIMADHSSKCRRVLELKRELAEVNNWLIHKCEWAKEHINKIGFDLLVAKSEKPAAGGHLNRLKTAMYPEEARSLAAVPTKTHKHHPVDSFDHVPKLSKNPSLVKQNKSAKHSSQEEPSVQSQQQAVKPRKRNSTLLTPMDNRKNAAHELFVHMGLLRPKTPSDTKSRLENTPRFSHFREKYKKDSAHSPAAQLSSSGSDSGSLALTSKPDGQQFSGGVSSPSPAKVIAMARSEFGIQINRGPENPTPNLNRDLRFFDMPVQAQKDPVSKFFYPNSQPMDPTSHQPPQTHAETAQKTEQPDGFEDSQAEKNSRSSKSRYTGTAKNKLIKAVQKLEQDNMEKREKPLPLQIPVCSIAKSSFGDRSERSSSSKELLLRDLSLDMVAKQVLGSASSDSDHRASLTEFQKQARGDQQVAAAKPIGEIKRMPTGYFSDECLDAPETGLLPASEPQNNILDLRKMKTICKEFFNKMQE